MGGGGQECLPYGGSARFVREKRGWELTVSKGAPGAHFKTLGRGLCSSESAQPGFDWEMLVAVCDMRGVYSQNSAKAGKTARNSRIAD